MNQLESILVEKIIREGPISFEDFMDTVLYYPRLGYYERSRIPIGPGGDYYTSPHLHDAFGWVIAEQIIEMHKWLGAPEDFDVVELGAGKGFLARSIGERLLKRGYPICYIIVEGNPERVEEQRTTLSRFPVKWAETLEEVSPLQGVILTNEVFDALPFRVVEHKKGRFYEVRVDYRDGNFIEVLHPPDSPISEYIRRYSIPEIEGYRTEVNLRARRLIQEIGKTLLRGFVVTIDYGYTAREYYAPERTRGTFLCYYRHQVVEDPYRHIGEQDITAHVNFTALRDWGEEAGLKAVGYCPQGTFLVSSGIDRIISEKLKEDKAFMNEIKKIKGLLFGMGDTHQVFVQYRGKDNPELSGFRLRNRLYRL